jgi:hypothetical protein
MSIELKINELNDSDHKNEIVGENDFKLNTYIAEQSREYAEKLNLGKSVEESITDVVEQNVEKTTNSEKTTDDNSNDITSIKEDFKILASKMIKKHLLPSLKIALQKLNEE